MMKPRISKDYIDGCRSFVDFAVLNCRTPDGLIYCPCKACCLNKRHNPALVFDHLTGGKGMSPQYKEWIYHGEPPVRTQVEETNLPRSAVDAGPSTEDVGGNMQALLRDLFGVHDVREDNNEPQLRAECGEEHVSDDTPDRGDAQKYDELLKNSDKPLHGKTKHSKLSATVHLYNLKCLGGVTNTIFSALLEFVNQLLPDDGEPLPDNTYQAKKFLKDMGLGYEKIPACRNDCMLFWKDNKDLESCLKCGQSKWKDEVHLNDYREIIPTSKKRPAKVLRWFPLIPRLQRLFMSQRTAQNMRWHAEGRTKDGVLRHPADGEAWKSFDNLHPDFSSESRNVRLGLMSDGFNPFGNMSTSHSTWPVMLVPYNLPPWMCMKQPSFILSLVISGPKSPGMDIDVYLQPLIDELQELWNVGVRTFDVSNRKHFMMRAQLMWTINDFPAYADLSGWPTRGVKACPCCMYSTRSTWLKHGKKYCFMGHRRYLPMDHPFRRNRRTFDGKQEFECAPEVPSGEEILTQLQGMVFGDESAGKTPKPPPQTKKDRKKNKEKQPKKKPKKKRKRNNNKNQEEPVAPEVLWKKKSIFFRLPYWKDNLLRHNLDVMHIEKNVMDNILRTLLDMKDKSKDNLQARQDLQEMGLRPKLHPYIGDDGRTYLPPAPHTMSTEDKIAFLQVLQDVKVPDGYASNISRCVKMDDHTLSGLKSHDNHVIMQQLLPIALRGSKLPSNVIKVLVDMSTFFRGICETTLTHEALDRLQEHICMTLCLMEQIFPPSFFTSMVHVVVHLVRECRLGGPVHDRWMYPGER
jgi:hypothetical protein